MGAIGVLIVAYAAASHYSNSHSEARGIATGLALAPMLAFGFGLVWRVRGGRIAGGLGVATALLLYLGWPELRANFALVYLTQQVGFYVLMALTFALTLRRDSVPLCTRLADRVHGPLGAAELQYTRRVTVAWTVFFLANAAAAFLLFAFAPLRIWSLYSNFCAMPLIGLMFIAEYAVRRRALPQIIERSGFFASMRVFFVTPP